MSTLADEARQTARMLVDQENVLLRREAKDLRYQLELLQAQEQKNAELVAQYFVMLDAIPPCPLHGKRCMQFARNWVRTAAQVMDIFDALPRLKEGDHP